MDRETDGTQCPPSSCPSPRPYRCLGLRVCLCEMWGQHSRAGDKRSSHRGSTCYIWFQRLQMGGISPAGWWELLLGNWVRRSPQEPWPLGWAGRRDGGGIPPPGPSLFPATWLPPPCSWQTPFPPLKTASVTSVEQIRQKPPDSFP